MVNLEIVYFLMIALLCFTNMPISTCPFDSNQKVHQLWKLFTKMVFLFTHMPTSGQAIPTLKNLFFWSFLPLSWSEWPWWSVRTLPASGRCHLPRLPRGDAPTSRRRWRGRRPSDGRARRPSPPSQIQRVRQQEIMEHGDLTCCNHQICDTNWFYMYISILYIIHNISI